MAILHTLRLTRWVILLIPRLARAVVHHSRRIVLVLLGGVFVLCGIVLNLTVLGGICGFPLVILALLLIGLSLL